MGAELLREFASLAETSEVVLAHHERYDGTGYPNGLSGDQIPLPARIIAVADSWHAMREDRSYRAALSLDEAVGEHASSCPNRHVFPIGGSATTVAAVIAATVITTIGIVAIILVSVPARRAVNRVV